MKTGPHSCNSIHSKGRSAAPCFPVCETRPAQVSEECVHPKQDGSRDEQNGDEKNLGKVLQRPTSLNVLTPAFCQENLERFGHVTRVMESVYPGGGPCLDNEIGFSDNVASYTFEGREDEAGIV